MPVISGRSSLGAGATLDNALAGSQFEFLPYDASLEFAVLSDQADTIADVYSGQDVLLEAGNVTEKTVLSAIYPDDFSLTDVAAAGERLKVRFTAVTAAAIAWTVRITPI